MAKMVSIASIIFTTTYIFLSGFGDAPRTNMKDPVFENLRQGAEYLEANIYDGKKIIHVKEISFFGDTKVSGIRSIDDDSVTQFDLSAIQSLEITAQNYTGERYRGLNQQWCSIKKTMLDGTVTENLLAPTNTIVCGIEKSTGDRKAWYLSNLNKIEISTSQLDSKKTYTDISKIIAHDNELEGVLEKKKFNNIIETEPIQVKSVGNAFEDIISSIFALIKAIFHFFKNLFW